MDCSSRAPLSMGFSKLEYWSWLPCPSPGDLPHPGIEPVYPALWADSLLSEPPGKPPDHQGSPFNKYFDGKVGEGKLVNCHSNLTLLLSKHYKLEVTVRIPRWHSGKESICQHRRRSFDPWVRKIPWSRKWQPTPVFLPGESHGQRSLAGSSPWGCQESDKNKVT